MKHSKFINVIFVIICVSLVACNDNESFSTLRLNKLYYEVPMEPRHVSIPIINGSGDIDLIIQDEDILNAIYLKNNESYEENGMGYIKLYGKKKGLTTLTVVDKVDNRVEYIDVKIVDCYLAYVIQDSNYPLFKSGSILFFVNNYSGDCYVLANDDEGESIQKGSYEFFTSPKPADIESADQIDVIPNLSLSFSSNSDGIGNGNDIISHVFEIDRFGSTVVIDCIQKYCGVDWEKLISNPISKGLNQIDVSMTLTIPNTDYYLSGVLSMASMPESILD